MPRSSTRRAMPLFVSATFLVPALAACGPRTTSSEQPRDGAAGAARLTDASVARPTLPGPTVMRPDWVWMADGRAGAMAQVGTAAPSLDLVAADGGGGRTSMDAGDGTVTVLYFWATWCRACKENMRAMDERARAYAADGVRFLGVCTDQGGTAMTSTARQHGMNWPTAWDRSKRAAAEYGAAWLPYVVIVGADGRIQASGLHLRHFDQALDEVLAMRDGAASG